MEIPRRGVTPNSKILITVIGMGDPLLDGTLAVKPVVLLQLDDTIERSTQRNLIISVRQLLDKALVDLGHVHLEGVQQ